MNREHKPWYKELKAIDLLFLALTLCMLGFGLFLYLGGQV